MKRAQQEQDSMSFQRLAGAAGRGCLVVASVAMLAACGQRSDMAEPCDGDTEASGGSYFCVGERVEQDQGEALEGEDASSPLPDASPDLSHHTDEDEADAGLFLEEDASQGWSEDLGMPEAPAPPTSYPLDARGFPIPAHANSFREIKTSSNAACIVDEFSQLFCWELEFTEDGQIKSKLEGQARIERFYEERTGDFALDALVVCVEQWERALCKRIGGEEWLVSLTIPVSRDPIGPLSIHSSMLCGLFWAQPVCTWHELYDWGEGFDGTHLAGALEWEGEYRSFDLKNFSQGRNEVFCAVTKREGEIVCRSAINFNWWKTDRIVARSANFNELRTGGGFLAGLRWDGEVEIHIIDTWSSEGLTEAQTYRATVTPKIDKLYSNFSALTADGEVIYWNFMQIRDMFEYAGNRTTVYHRVLDIETPKSFDVMSGHWKAGAAWCSLSERSEVKCGYFPKHEDW